MEDQLAFEPLGFFLQAILLRGLTPEVKKKEFLLYEIKQGKN